MKESWMADDRELWERICRGDTSAFEGFYRENAPRLQAFLGQLLSTPQAAEDVAQETFLQPLKRPNGFRPDTSLRAYLFGIAKRRTAAWWRQQAPAGEANAEGPEPPKAEAA